MARRTSTEQLEKAARLADAAHELIENSGVISINGIGRPNVLLHEESFFEAFGERDIVTKESDDYRFYYYDDGHTVWEANEPIRKEQDDGETV